MIPITHVTRTVGVVALSALLLAAALLSAPPAHGTDTAGTVSLTPTRLHAGTVVTATLRDPDGGVASVSWQWHSSSDTVTWTSISGATNASYTPVADDVGAYLRATVNYSDEDGPGKSAAAVSSDTVGDRAPAPDIWVTTLVSGLSIPWDMAFTPDGTMLFTQRAGVLSSRLIDGTVQTVTADLSDLWIVGETGFLAIAVDPDFASNRRFYTCQGERTATVEVIAWTIDDAYAAATRVADPLVGDIPAATTHTGCRLRFGPEGHLWIATGDAATGTVPQDLDSFGGKILRVDASTGAAAPGNPFSSRVYTYGHRNPQGLARRPGTSQMWAVEHGPTVDDEINLLTAGGNYGWDPIPGYDQSVPMTDLAKFPSAIEARWSSGDPTLATSGGIFLEGSDWGEWEGRLAVATLANRTLRVFDFARNGALVSQVVVPELNGTFGRLRTPMLGPDGALYISTSNGGDQDRILRVTGSEAPAFLVEDHTTEVVEGGSVSNIVAKVLAIDPNDDALTYALGGADAASFTITDSAVGELRANAELDFNARSSYRVIVTATNTSGMSDSIRVTINVTRGSLNPPPRDPVAAFPSTAVYDVIFDGDWTRAATPGGVPGGAHFSRLVGAVHNDGVTFLESGGTASAGIESMAELGGTSALKGEVGAEISDSTGDALRVLEGGTDFISPTASRTLNNVALTTAHPRVTLVTMVAPSPDWFVGVAGLPLLSEQGRWLRSHQVNLYPWDAGTENGSEFSLDNTATNPQGTIRNIRGTGKFSAEPIATLTFALQSVRTTRSVAESSPAGVNIGARLAATDSRDAVTYTLIGGDTAFFTIDQHTGQLRTSAAIDRAIGDTYSVTVTTDDGRSAAADIEVTIAVTERPAPPSFFGGGGGGPSGPSPSILDFEWNVTRDIEELDSGNGAPTGLWSDGVTLWVLQNGDGADDAVYAYDLESGERAEEREFELDERNRAPRGIWSDRATVWVSDSGQERLFAHDLETGERLPGRDITLAGRNAEARGIWSRDETMWVLDDRRVALFAYDRETGEPLSEYALDPQNVTPHGLWSDGVTFWVSNHNPKRLFAYRVPALPASVEAAEGEEEADGEVRDLERVRGEEFTELSSAGNNSPRGLWSDGDVMYVADPNDHRVYTFNMPDAIDARLASLVLSDVDIGEFSSGVPEYRGLAADGVTETTVEASAIAPRATVAIEPPDPDEDAENGHEVALVEDTEIRVTVTSEDGSRMRVYRVQVGGAPQEAASGPAPDCLRGATVTGLSLVVYEGGGIEELEACARGRDVTALYTLDGGVSVPYILGAPDLVNRSFRELYPAGLPALAPLIVKSDGPPTADPEPRSGRTPDDGLPQCLHGATVTGLSLVVYEGGSIEQLEACVRSRDVTAVYTLDGGVSVPYILGAPDLVNRTFRELYAGGVPPITPLIVKSTRPAAAGSDPGGAAGN